MRPVIDMPRNTRQLAPRLVRSAILAMSLLCMPFAAGAKPYKAAEIYTFDSMLYGKYVMRMRVAKGGGVISAFFLFKNGSEQPEVFWEEVDIEAFGKNNAASWQSNIITGLDPRVTSEQVHNAGVSLGDDYHTFTLEWAPNSVTWSIDGNAVRTANAANSDQADDLVNPSQIRFNVWPSENVDWAGAWDDSILPVTMLVDWVEYYPWNGAGFDVAPQWRDDFNSFDTTRWAKADWTFDGNRADFTPQNAYIQNGNLVLAITRDAPSGASSGSSSGGGSGSGAGTGLLAVGFLSFIFRIFFRCKNPQRCKKPSC